MFESFNLLSIYKKECIFVYLCVCIQIYSFTLELDVTLHTSKQEEGLTEISIPRPTPFLKSMLCVFFTISSSDIMAYIRVQLPEWRPTLVLGQFMLVAQVSNKERCPQGCFIKTPTKDIVFDYPRQFPLSRYYIRKFIVFLKIKWFLLCIL